MPNYSIENLMMFIEHATYGNSLTMKELETSIYSHYNDVPADVISDVLTTVLDAITDKYSAVYYPANFVCTATYVGFVKKELQEII